MTFGIVRFCCVWAFFALGMVSAFIPSIINNQKYVERTSLVLHSTQIACGLKVELSKPLGLILEESDKGGVFVAEVSPDGSASAHKSEILNMKLLKVGDADVSSETLERIMGLIVDTEEPVALEFQTMLPKGTLVVLTVQTNDGEKQVSAKVGDNLRQSLIDNNVEVYSGFKQKGFNCGGAGQCTFCAFNVVDSGNYWLERSDYEDSKLGGNFPLARLTCLNEIQGPATLRKIQR